MSLALATKGILPDFTGTGTGSGPGETITEYVAALINIEPVIETIEVEATVIDAIDVASSSEITVEIEFPEDDVITAEEISVDVTTESIDITVEVSP
jgi:hypothetical protein